ncbi:MAG TPA: BON domain-containing protein [Burkholderiales bacterium]|nr:BON domain-containing protein [Burkholderiales bacterium]
MDLSRRRIMAVTLAAAALTGLSACASKDPAIRRTAGETASDATLTAKVKTAIATDAGARTASAVNVTTYGGTVQLSGFVDNQDQANRAVAAAKKVEGVKSVKNDLRVKSPG